jgi:glycosyltransferase involved in cell wall biosynthesis
MAYRAQLFASVDNPVTVPRVSVITPTWGRPDKHAQLLAVFDSQDWPNKELLVSDDSDTPSPTLSRLRRPDVRYVYSKTRMTIGAKRNALTSMASGDIIVAFDDDDVYAPSYLRTAVAWLQDSDFAKLSVWRIRREHDGTEWEWDTGSCGGQCYAITGDGETHGPDQSDGNAEHCDSALWGYGFSYAYRRSVATSAPFADMSLGEDYEWVCRVRQAFRCKLVSDGAHLVMHTLHPRSTSACFPQRRIDSMTGVGSRVDAGKRYEGIALLKSNHTLVDLRAKLAAKGVQVEELVELTKTPSGMEAAPNGYRYVRFVAIANQSVDVPDQLPAPLRWVDKSRVVQMGVASLANEHVHVVRLLGVHRMYARLQINPQLTPGVGGGIFEPANTMCDACECANYAYDASMGTGQRTADGWLHHPACPKMEPNMVSNGSFNPGSVDAVGVRVSYVPQSARTQINPQLTPKPPTGCCG